MMTQPQCKCVGSATCSFRLILHSLASSTTLRPSGGRRIAPKASLAGGSSPKDGSPRIPADGGAAAGPAPRLPSLADLQQDARAKLGSLVVRQADEAGAGAAAANPTAVLHSSGAVAQVDAVPAEVLAPGPPSSSSSSPPETAVAEADDERSDQLQEAELALQRNWQRLQQRWKLLLKRPLAPVPPELQSPGADGFAGQDVGSSAAAAAAPDDGDGAERSAVQEAEGGATASSSSSSRDSALVEVGGANAGGGIERPPQWLAWRALQLTLVASFMLQWAPLAQAMVQGGLPLALRDVALGVLLVCPATPHTCSWQLDPFAVASGSLVSLFTSSLLHSGLASLMVSLASLEETVVWMDTAHGTLITLISYAMAALGAAACQVYIAGQPVGISGIAAALGMEVAVLVRHWRVYRTFMAPTPATAACAAVGVGMALYQPMLGTWGLLGGLLGGALSGILAYDVLWVMRIAVGMVWLGLSASWSLLKALPVLLYRLAMLLGMLVWGTITSVYQAVLGV